MKIQTKTLIHYIINTIVTLITVGVLVCTLTMNPKLSTTQKVGIGFGVIFIMLLISYIATTILLANDHKKPQRSLLPLTISLLVMTLYSTIIVAIYSNFFKNNWFENAIEYSLWLSILMMFLGVVFGIVIAFIQVYITKFLLSSVSGNRAAEWEVQNAFSLCLVKAEIRHSNSYSYLFNKNKLLVISFITEENIERRIDFVTDERFTKSQIILDLENEIDRLNKKLNINSYGSIVYLSNKIPTTSGQKPKNLFIIRNNDLFNQFKKLESTIINIEEVKEVV